MMIVDASALVAILLDEPEAPRLASRLEAPEQPLTHAISVYEAVTAVARETRRGLAGASEDVAALILNAGIEVVPLGAPEAAAALAAFARYGKGQGHPAQLNMGDCFSYGCATTRGMPLLYKGGDFAQTDLA
jgi:ribonuclease VapC